MLCVVCCVLCVVCVCSMKVTLHIFLLFRQLEALDKELQQLSDIKENVDAKVKCGIQFIFFIYKKFSNCTYIEV